MNYRHIYHAGNFADIAKHVGLLYCLDALKRKSAAFFALDSHAGRGFYDLQSAEARQSGEAERGIQRLIEAAGGAAGRAAERGIQRLIEAAGGAAGQAAAGAGRAAGDAVLAGYLQAIRARHGKRLARYPGSPALIAASLRPQDRALFVELLPAEARAAGREIQSDGRVRTEIGDGYAALKAFLPPAERRGLVLIDPPYESLDELKILLQSFTAAYRRWPSGIYLMWYPIRSSTQRRTVHARFEGLGIPKILFADLAIHADDAGLGLAGSGLMMVNPPYGADDYLRGAYAAIHRALAPAGAGYVEVARLTPERMAQ